MTKTVRKPSLATRLRDLVAGDSGFTLLETLAVMVIIGLLAAITVPQIAKWREKAYITSMKTDARNLYNAVEVFNADKQRWPTRAEYTALVAADVKLNPGNRIAMYPGNPGIIWTTPYSPNLFALAVYSSKTDSWVRYANVGIPTIWVFRP